MSLNVLMIIALFTTGLDACNIRICLTWTVDNYYIVLRCRVNNLNFAVEFYNNKRIEQGYCVSPKPTPLCLSSYNNTSIKQNTITNITYLRISGLIDSHVNGQWECKHGTNTDSAVINVTVLDSGLRKNKTDDKLCWQSYLAYTMIGLSCVMFLRLCQYLVCRFKSKVTASNLCNQGCKEKLTFISWKKDDHINYNSCEHRSTDYWAGDTYVPFPAKSKLKIAAVFVMVFLFLVPVITGNVDRGICEGEEFYIIDGLIIACLFLFIQEDNRAQPNDTDGEEVERIHLSNTEREGYQSCQV